MVVFEPYECKNKKKWLVGFYIEIFVEINSLFLWFRGNLTYCGFCGNLTYFSESPIFASKI
jgi:hypothetical protein